jgi:hypothetical protein
LGVRRYRVAGYTVEFVSRLSDFYEALEAAGGRYSFYCVKGRCWSIIEGGDELEALLSSTPGLQVEECGRYCPESDVLLPPPPAPIPPRLGSSFHGDIVVGYSGGQPVGLPKASLWSHIGVFGATGSGKSHTAARLAGCAANVLNVAGLVLDWHNEYYRLLPSNAKLFTSTRLPRVSLLSSAMSVDETLGVLEEVLELSKNQSLLLTIVLSATATGDIAAAEAILAQLLGADNPRLRSVARRLVEARDLRDLLKAVLEVYNARTMDASKGELEAWAALIRRLAMLALDERYARFFTLREAGELPVTEGEVAIIDLSSILNPGVRKLYAMLLLEALYVAAQQAYAPPILAVVEEAHNFATAATLLHLLGEARKYKLGVVVVTHTPHLLEQQALANLNTLIIHRVVSADDIRAIEMLLPELQGISLSRLPNGVAALYTPGMEEPVLVEVASPREPCH